MRNDYLTSSMLNPRLHALFLAICITAFGILAPHYIVFRALSWSMDIAFVAMCFLALNVIGLLIFTAFSKRNDLNLIWLIPSFALSAYQMLRYLIGYVATGNIQMLFEESFLYSLLFVCLIVLASMILATSKRTGLTIMSYVLFALVPLVMQQIHFPYIWVVPPENSLL
ncbi:hypothetical protein ACFL48_00085 [Pseudomonadota bacterium]